MKIAVPRLAVMNINMTQAMFRPVMSWSASLAWPVKTAAQKQNTKTLKKKIVRGLLTAAYRGANREHRLAKAAVRLSVRSANLVRT